MVRGIGTGKRASKMPTGVGQALRIGHRHATLLWAGMLAWALGVFAVEVATGPHFTFEPFYVPVVVFAAWRGGRLLAAGFSMVCAVLGVIAEHLLSEPLLAFTAVFEHPAIPYWNGVAHLMMYLVVGLSVSALHAAVSERDKVVAELREAAKRIRTLQGLLPMCAWCKGIRDEQDLERWMPLEQYVSEHTNAQVTHGICPSCAQTMRRPMV